MTGAPGDAYRPEPLSFGSASLGGAPGVIGVGVDLLDVERLDAERRREGSGFLDRVFHPDEIAYCDARARPEEHYAARFAAKEAFAKALGTGIAKGVSWREIEVARDESGAPFFRLHGETAHIARGLGVRRVHLSLSHARTVAAAIVVIEGSTGDPGGGRWTT